ncbi:MoxR-like ATPase [Halorientalis persicus]|uniref:MoxR-like ATPase n=1 Tax=Halorientalis persicus TaxID=1367881 RepID=A0A1H8W0C6_9EURY|nr:MoxR family ATPase [Halorientalis persicus]SEP21034.1 MoxR-like ATPase [Halorientalis persicus]
MTDPETVFESICEETSQVLVGNNDILEGLTISLFTEGHVLLEGVPGVAKTTIANLFAQTLGLEYRRVQMTPDLLPADITGSRIYRAQSGNFDLQRGPVFSNVVVADEINRATPKTQSALLEAMEERQVTIEGETQELPSPFIVIATQNPIEMEGTFGLPEAQRDRFLLKLRVDIPDRDLEAQLLDEFHANPDIGASEIETVVAPSDITTARETVQATHLTDPIRDYILDIVEGTRESSKVAYGASPRAAISLLRASKARAAIRGREYVIPDDPKRLAERVLAHRLVLSTDAEMSGIAPETVVRNVLETVAAPEPTAELEGVTDAEGSAAAEERQWQNKGDGEESPD